MSHVAYIALGSNLGDRLASLQRAVRLLMEVPEVNVDAHAIASLYETQPIGDEQMPLFLNSALRAVTSLTPKAVMQVLLEIERLMGRKRQYRWESRVIDLDLLLVDQLVCHDRDVVLPHPRLHERRFVLEPLAEIAGELIHPILGASIADLAVALREGCDQKLVRIADPQWVST